MTLKSSENSLISTILQAQILKKDWILPCEIFIEDSWKSTNRFQNLSLIGLANTIQNANNER